MPYGGRWYDREEAVQKMREQLAESDQLVGVEERRHPQRERWLARAVREEYARYEDEFEKFEPSMIVEAVVVDDARSSVFPANAFLTNPYNLGVDWACDRFIIGFNAHTFKSYQSYPDDEVMWRAIVRHELAHAEAHLRHGDVSDGDEEFEQIRCAVDAA